MNNEKSLKILIVGYNHPACDKRTKRSAVSLSKIYKVYYQFLQSEKDDRFKMSSLKFCEDELRGVFVVPLSYYGSSGRNLVHWFWKWVKFDRDLWKLIRELSPDIVYFHDLPFTFDRVVNMTKSLGITIFHEAHEILPDQYLRSIPIPVPSFIERRLVKVLWKKYKSLLSNADKVIFVSKEAGEYIFANSNYLRPDFFVLPNVALRKLDCVQSGASRLRQVAIVGGTQRRVSGGVLKAIERLGFELKAIGGSVDLVGNDNMRVVSVPFLPYNDMLSEIAKVMFVLISYLPDKEGFYSNHLYSLPNKLYDALAAGTPVIVHSCYFKTAARLVEKDGVGIVFNDINELRHKLLNLTPKGYDMFLRNIEKRIEKYYWSSKMEEDYLNFIRG